MERRRDETRERMWRCKQDKNECEKGQLVQELTHEPSLMAGGDTSMGSKSDMHPKEVFETWKK